MEFKTYKKRVNLKHCCIVAVCTALILVPIAVSTTRAKYSTSESVPLTRGTVNYKVYDFKIMAMYQENDSGEYEEVEVMPTSGYVINEDKSYCYTTTQEEHDDTAVLRTDSEGNHEVGNLKKNSKCYLWFDINYCKGKGNTCETILANKTVQTISNITGISSDTSNVLYATEDDDGTSYVFRGNPSNNWVQFGGFHWRIIRINGDGTIRMIYTGGKTTTGTGTQITINSENISEYNNYASGYGDNAHVGYMYGTVKSSTYSATHVNTNNSTIKNSLDTWYTSNGLNSYESYIDTNAGFCNDRQINSAGGQWSTDDTAKGFGQNVTVYAPYSRIMLSSGTLNTEEITPTLKCNQIINDLFTPTYSLKGNKKLTNPLGLITLDEVILAGGFGGISNSSYYLYTNQGYWTMSPYGYNANQTRVYIVNVNGTITAAQTNQNYGIRPVINLRSDVTLSGDGTVNSPFTVS